MLKDLRRSLALLSPRDRFILGILVLFQFSLALLDLVAIAALGVVTSLAAASATGQSSSFLPFLADLLGDPPEPRSVLALAMAAGVLLVLKSALSFWGTRRAFRFLANRQAMVSSRLANELLSRPLLQVQRRSSQENSFALTIGVQAMTVGVIGQAVIIVSELVLTLVLLVGLLAIDPLLTVFTAIFFAGVAMALHLLLARWAQRIGKKEAQANALSMTAVQESLRGYREVTVSGRRGVYTERFHDVVWNLARIQADRVMVTTIGKYVFEVALIVGAGLLILAQTASGKITEAAAIIAVFLAAASRIMPALLRLQGAMLSMRISVGTAHISADLINELSETEPDEPVSIEVLERMFRESAQGYPGFDGSVRISHATLTYPDADTPALLNVSLNVPAGTSLALVGSTGAGKSTLADVILGVIEPNSGVTELGGMSPNSTVARWPGAIAYVPQEVAIVNGTIRGNVAMGLPERMVDDERAWEALQRARLADLLTESREGLDTVVGEHGVKLSGGQRQRLGIARALYTRPRLLVMDEATSALDAETESAVTETLSSMSGEVTLIIIAHRLATIRHCDQVAYLRDGQVVVTGSFSEVRSQVPEFERQAQLLGL